MKPWRLTAVAGERCAPERRTMTSQWLRRRRCFGPRYRTLGITFTSEEVFTWAKSNNRRLLHVSDIDKTSNWLQRIGWSQPVIEERCQTMWGAFMQVKLLHLKGAFMRMWEARSKWKTPQSKFFTFETWGDTRKT
uniref:Uncharacterized protein n=1 Tax=Oryza punctata TaxID=4537 RepID=A0A0E0JYF1_ORYPU